MNSETTITEIIKNNIEKINRLMFIESTMKEMDRNKLSYVQINHLEEMNFERSIYNAGTVIGTAYNREDYQRYIDFKKSDPIELPGTLDVYFSTNLVKETVSIERSSDGIFYFPTGYYIYIKNTSKNYTLLENDERKWGIVESAPKIYVTDSDSTEEFEVLKYDYIDFSESLNTDDFSVVDVLFKGFYPVFIDFTAYTKDGNSNSERILDSINAYLDTISGDMAMISHNEMNDAVRKNGDNILLAVKNSSEGFSNMNMAFQNEVVFPITMKDISIPVEIRRPSISEKTIRVYARSVNVIKE
jgi:hypothetical protein